MLSRTRPALLLFALSCARPAPPDLAPLSALRVGVDPVAEARAAAERFRARGRRVHRELAGPGVAAFAATEPSTGRSFVRVYTSRGLALALEAPGDAHGALDVDLHDLAPRDLDGDGRTELVLAAADPARGRRCLTLLRADEAGGLEPVAPPLERYGGESCLEVVGDLAGDARLEALARVRYPSLALGPAPTLPVLFGGGPRWDPLPLGAARAFYAAEDAARAEALTGATAVSFRHRQAGERAGLARLQNADGEAQASRFLEALGTVEPRHGPRRETTRAFIARGGRAPAPVQGAPPRVDAPLH
ncbi:MAG: hypothetical protein AAF447_01900 [Myxococcota bacterium]